MNKVIEGLIICIGVLSLVCLYLAGLGYQHEAFGLGQAFTILRWSAIGGIIGAGLVILWILWRRPVGVRLAALFVSAVMGLLAFYLPYQQSRMAQSVPPIHDITTDTGNPPAFVAVVPLRADAPNPAEYAGEETASLQQGAYPDLMTLVYQEDFGTVFAAAEAVVADMGWEPVASVQEDGRIEATAVTRWFGFKDDVVIRIDDRGAQGVHVDIRSKSRVGRSDIGTNAARIRAFREALNARLNG